MNVDPALPVFDARTLDDRLGESLGRRRVATWSIGVFASLALALSLIGVYGVIAYDVSQRAREISIRMALGADRHAVLGLVMRGGVRIAMLGNRRRGRARIRTGARGERAALRRGRARSGRPTSSLAIVLLGFAAAAAYIPARRATALDPISSLRG